MTEQEWLARTEPRPMLEFLRGKASDRKLRLFSAACCRRVWHLLSDEQSRKAVDLVEQHADRMAGIRELRIADDLAFSSFCAIPTIPECRAEQQATHAVVCAAEPCAFFSAYQTVRFAGDADRGGMTWGLPHSRHKRLKGKAGRHFCALLRDIFGPLPFRIVTADPAWLSSTVTALAQAIYQERAFDRMPILADALEDAGCDQQDILNHCRQPGEHVRGCWALDMLLGKE